MQTALQAQEEVVLFPTNSVWKYRLGTGPASSPDPTAWRRIDFDDSDWAEGPTPIGYQRGKDIGIVTDLGTSAQKGYLTVFLRKSFQIDNPYDYSELQLPIRIDDGYVVWLNGEEIGRYNAPSGELSYDSTAVQPNGWWPTQVPVVVSNAWKLLRPGENVLAVHLLNINQTSSDLFFDTALIAKLNTTPPKVVQMDPPPGAVLRQFTTIEVWFDRPVTGVDASDLLINGTPAMEVRFGEPGHFVFIVPEPEPGPVEIRWAENHGIKDTTSLQNPFQGGSWGYIYDPTGQISLVRINEFMASNKRTLRDEDGDSSDWIELYNAGQVTENLEGWFLTDDPDNLTKWRFPKIALPPDSYLLVFASGKDRTDPSHPLHTNFRLSASGGYLALVDPHTNIVSDFDYPEQYEDVSYGADRMDPTTVGYFLEPTPGKPNAVSGQGFAPPVEFSRPSGTFIRPFQLELHTTSPDAEIHYTLDGSFPTKDSPLYTGPISITQTVEVRARAFQQSLLPGPPTTALYLRLDPSVTNFTSNLPVIILDNLGAGSIPASPVEKRQPVVIAVFAPGPDGRVHLTDQPVIIHRGGFNIRGSSTKHYPKTSFRLEFWDEFDTGDPVALLGMPADPDWILYAPNYFDLPLIHNPFIYQLSNEIGQYAARTRLVEIFLNTDGGPIRGPAPSGDYHGVYVLMEAIKRDPHRVAIEELKPEHTQPPQITGGYLLKVDRCDPDERSFSAGGLQIIYQYPKGLEMVTPQRKPQADYIKQYIDDFYDALRSPNPDDPTTGYPAYIDFNSWIDHHILNVLAMNVDALRLSAYFFKPRNDKLHMGPIWDFDRSMGTSKGGDLRPFNPLSWMGANPLGHGSDYGTDFFNPNNVFPNPWYSRLFQRPDFWQRWIDRYQMLRDAQFSTNHIFAIIDQLAGELQEAEPRDLERWRHAGPSDPSPRSGTVSVPGYSHTFPGTYQGEIDFMKQWLAEHMHFIDTNLLARPRVSRPSGYVPPGTQIQLEDVSNEPGTILYYTLDGTDPRAPGGQIASTAHRYSHPIQIQKNTLLIARAYNPNHRNLTGPGNPPISSPWSGPTFAFYRTHTPQVVINEWMADNTRSLYEPETHEYKDWIELYNPTDTPVDLSGYTLTDRLWEPKRFRIPEGTIIQPHGFLLIWADNQPEANAPGKPLHASFALNAQSDAIGLFAPDGTLVDAVTFGPQTSDVSQGRWPDGAPRPFVRMTSPTPGMPNLPATWPPQEHTGTPQPGSILINEWMADNQTVLQDPADGQFKDWFELYNPGSEPIDLSGWTLTDQLNDPKRWTIPDGTIIPPGGYLLIWADMKPELTGTNGLHTNFRLNRDGEAIGLYAPDGTLIDLVIFGPQMTDLSQGRWPDGQLAPYYYFAQPTPGDPNQKGSLYPAPKIIAIQRTADGIQLTWETIPGATYHVESRPHLTSGTWETISPSLTASEEILSFTVPLAQQTSTCFYRIVLETP